jgi:hypothetical protein
VNIPQREKSIADAESRVRLRPGTVCSAFYHFAWTTLTDINLAISEDLPSHGSDRVSNPQAVAQLPLPSTSHITGADQFSFELDAEDHNDVQQVVHSEAELSFSNSSGTPRFMNDLFMPNVMSSGNGGEHILAVSGGFDVTGQFSDHDPRHVPRYGSSINLGETSLNNSCVPPTISNPSIEQGGAPLNDTAPTSKMEIAPLLADHL